jgi:hypothetical protein
MCYEILSGNKVFSPALSAAEIRRKTMNNQERPQIPSCIKGDFGKLIERCWNSDPSKRPPIGEVWHTLERMNFQIIDGVDSGMVRKHIATWSPEGGSSFGEGTHPILPDDPMRYFSDWPSPDC